MDNFQYELPENFIDEEIDEELAFTEEDRQKMAKASNVQAETEEPATYAPLTRDDFSDEVRKSPDTRTSSVLQACRKCGRLKDNRELYMPFQLVRNT